MKLTFSFLILVLLMSCGTKKNQVENETSTDQTNTSINTELKMLVKIPYCGGARPTEEMLNRTKPVVAKFILKGDNGFEKEVNSDELGSIKLNLKKGKYQLKEIGKHTTFELFFTAQTAEKKTNIKKGSEASYKEWWQKNVIDFEITDTTTIFKGECFLFSNCYTTNPCDRYTGPIRP